MIKTGSSNTQSVVFEYTETSAADGAITGLNNLDIAGFKLAAQRVPLHAAAVLLQPAQVPATVAPTGTSAPPPPTGPRDPLTDHPPTTVIRLSNMTTQEDLTDDELYLELQEDVAEECNNYGAVRSIIIPRSSETGNSGAVGYVFVHFNTVEGAIKAKAAVSGRSFNGQLVGVVFYPEALFTKKVGW